jgi:hypothetical protein
MLHKIIYYLGKHSYLFRKLILKLTGTWYWGIIPFIKEGFIFDPKPITIQDLKLKNREDWLNKQTTYILLVATQENTEAI